MKMKPLLIGWMLMSLCALPSQAKRVRHPAKKSTPSASATYFHKLGVINRESTTSGAQLSQYMDDYDNARQLMSSPMGELLRQSRMRGENADVTLINRLRKLEHPNSQWFSVINAYRRHIRRFRSISPVPKSVKNVDAAWVRFSYAMDRSLDSIVSWRRGNGDYDEVMANYIKSLHLFIEAGYAVKRNNDTFTTPKKYVDG